MKFGKEETVQKLDQCQALFQIHLLVTLWWPLVTNIKQKECRGQATPVPDLRVITMTFCTCDVWFCPWCHSFHPWFWETDTIFLHIKNLSMCAIIRHGQGEGMGGDSPMQPVTKLPPMHRPFLDHSCRKNHQISQASPTHQKSYRIHFIDWKKLRCSFSSMCEMWMWENHKFLQCVTSQTVLYFSQNMSTFSAQCSI